MVDSGKRVSVASFDARINNRVGSIKEIFEQFLTDWGHIGVLDSGLLVETVRQYFKASDELKRRHGINHTDSHKRAAYTIWAISKYKPVRYIAHPDKSRILVNELFALCAGISHLTLDISDFDLHELDALLFLIHIRDIDPEWLALTMYLFEQRSFIRAQKEQEVINLHRELEKIQKKLSDNRVVQ